MYVCYYVWLLSHSWQCCLSIIRVVEGITCSLFLLYNSFPPGVKPVYLLIWFWNNKVIVTTGMPDYNSNHVFRFFQGITKHCWAFWVLHQQRVPSKCVASLSVIVIFSFLHIFTEKTGMWSFLELMMLIAVFPYQLADQGLGFIISTERYGREWEREEGASQEVILCNVKYILWSVKDLLFLLSFRSIRKESWCS